VRRYVYGCVHIEYTECTISLLFSQSHRIECADMSMGVYT